MTRRIFLALAAGVLMGCTAPDGAVLAARRPANATLKTADGPLVQAHRGGRYEYDDNAAGGFRRCLAAGVRGFELDIRFTKDHRLVLMHDGSVDRTTDGTGPVESLTFDEVRRLRLEGCSERVPSAEEVFGIFRDRPDVFIEIEMKAYPDAFYTPEVLADYCRRLSAAARAILPAGTYAFTCFNVTTLETMRAVDAAAPLGFITGAALNEEHLATARRLGCASVAPSGAKTTKEMVARAHAEGLSVCLWMASSKADWERLKEKGADRVTCDYPVLLTRAIAGRRKKIVALDLDATLCQHRSAPPAANLAELRRLCENYTCVMVGAGNAPRIHRQMGGFPIDIVGNYGMQIAEAADGKFRIVKAVTNAVDRAFFTETCDALRKKYGYTSYAGQSLEFHPSGMVTFALLGTAAKSADKIAFDPDRKKRRAMYADVLDIFKGSSCYIGGSTSFDIAGAEYNKYDATLAWARARGCTLDDIVFIGDDFADGGGDSHVRIKGMDYIVITDYKRFPAAVKVLLD